MTAAREPADHLRGPPLSVVLLVVLPEGEVEQTQLREPRQDLQDLLPKEEVQKACAVDAVI